MAATPQDICKDLQDGKVDGTYTAAEWTAFFQDTTVQGYCSPIVTVVPPPTTPPATTPPTTAPPATAPPATAPPATAPPAAAPPTSTPAPAAPVPLVPVVVSAVKGASHTAPAAKPAATPKTTTGVKGTQHTVTSAAPLSTAKKQGTLPFTGAQLALFLLVGLGLVATGLVLRATGRRRPEA